jgi:Glycosyl transferase family 11
MIVLHASGGLGNQLFNYAAARTLADRTHATLVVDAAAYRNQWGVDATRPHVLHRFPARARFRNLECNGNRRPLLSRIARRLREGTFAAVIDRPANEIGYFPGLQQLGRRTVLKGHFISPRFFAGNEDRIRQDLTLDIGVIHADEVANRVLAEMRSRGTPVAVHVRRGDLLNPELNWLLLPDIEVYYRNAFKRLAELLAEPVFWVFSDDPEWCRQTFAAFPGEVRIVDTLCDGRANPVKEFYLMSQCHSFVIANSAFSWWGAWLGSNEAKRVMTPDRWDNRGFVAMADLLPAEWERIAW